MERLKYNRCPNCGVALDKVRSGQPKTPCGMFHQHPGIAQLVISVVNGENDNLKSTVFEGRVITETEGDDSYGSAEEAVIAFLDSMHEVQFPSED
tara:strand:- start:3692 stop:3976 length:285 start_codon:yes stop_codon:yes gene_type:complete